MYEKGGKGKSKLFVLLALAAAFVVLGGTCLSQYNTLVRDEEGIRAQEKNIDIAIDKMVKKIQGSGHAVNDFKETMIAVLGQTIGQGGRAAAAGTFFNAVAEKYPDVPSHVWRDLTATMNAEYESFAASQGAKVSRLQTFRTHLRNPAYILAKILGGFPTISLSEHDKLILGSEARSARETGTIETVDPFKKQGG